MHCLHLDCKKDGVADTAFASSKAVGMHSGQSGTGAVEMYSGLFEGMHEYVLVVDNPRDKWVGGEVGGEDDAEDSHGRMRCLGMKEIPGRGRWKRVKSVMDRFWSKRRCAESSTAG